MNAKSLRVWEDAPVEVTIVATPASLDCVRNPGPCLSMMNLNHGTKGRFIFRNNHSPLSEPTTTAVDLKLASAGATIRALKQPLLGGIGVNPWNSPQFLRGDGARSEALEGRRLQLAPGT